MFTIDQIMQRLQLQGMSDSELPLAQIPLDGDEYLSVIQNNKNVLVNLTEIHGIIFKDVTQSANNFIANAQIEENLRQSDELIRQSQENIRILNEGQRTSEENNRVTAEDLRILAEVVREQQELDRQANTEEAISIINNLVDGHYIGFEIDEDMNLIMSSPDNYEGPEFLLENGELKVII